MAQWYTRAAIIARTGLTAASKHSSLAMTKEPA